MLVQRQQTAQTLYSGSAPQSDQRLVLCYYQMLRPFPLTAVRTLEVAAKIQGSARTWYSHVKRAESTLTAGQTQRTEILPLFVVDCWHFAVRLTGTSQSSCCCLGPEMLHLVASRRGWTDSCLQMMSLLDYKVVPVDDIEGRNTSTISQVQGPVCSLRKKISEIQLNVTTQRKLS